MKAGTSGSKPKAVKKHGPHDANADPLFLQASGKSRRKEQARREDLQRKHLSYLLGKGAISADMFRVGQWLHENHLIATGGMQAMDWLREKVDGGKGGAGAFGPSGVLDADRAIKRTFLDAGLSFNQMEIVMMVVFQELSLNATADILAARPGYALGADADDKAKRGHVGALLRDALKECHKVVYEPNRDEHKTARSMMRRWLAEDAIPSDRPDLRGLSTKPNEAA